MSTFVTNNDSIYWNSRYEDVVNYLTGTTSNSDQEPANTKKTGTKIYPVFKSNAEVCLFAAMLAVKKGLLSKVSSSEKKESKQIRLSVFQNSRLIGSLWSLYFISQPTESVDLLDLSSEFDAKIISQLDILIENGLAFLMDLYHPEYELPADVFVYDILLEHMGMTEEYFEELKTTVQA